MRKSKKTDYLDWFLKREKNWGCHSLFKSTCNPSKEITESVGAYKAVQNNFSSILYDKDTSIVVVGDGTTPRTASIFYNNSPAKIYSIDPEMRKPKIRFDSRLSIIKAKIEEVNIKANTAIIVCVHSHAPIKAILSNINAKKKYLVEIPCCFPYKGINCEYVDSYVDFNIISPRNTVNIYHNLI